MAGRKSRPNPVPGAASSSEPVRYALPQSLDMRAVKAFKTSLQGLRTSGNAILIDAAAVRRCTFGCIQVLAAYIRDQSATGIKVTLVNVTEDFDRSIELLGLRTIFSQASAD